MGKIKEESDDDMAMDIEPKGTLPIKKKKQIAKTSKLEASKTSTSSSKNKSINIIHSLARKVNLKQKPKSLDHKQAIFQRIVKGLHENNKISKKDKKKSRVMLKKEMRKHLEEQKIHPTKQVVVAPPSVYQQPSKNPQKYRKKQINERQISSKFQKLMGSSLANIRQMMAQKSKINKI